jgi:hypothetical protein
MGSHKVDLLPVLAVYNVTLTPSLSYRSPDSNDLAPFLEILFFSPVSRDC